jgi:ABC-type bacteriocin/lantibiotic exporter with double-glycine peptidase domain
MTNLLSIHASRISDSSPWLNDLWLHPLKIIIGMFLIWNYLGLASLAGICIIILSMPFTHYLNTKIEKNTEKQCETQDIRMKMLSEILSSIKVIKLYGWENSVCLKNILKLRNIETTYLTNSHLTGVLLSFINNFTPLALMASSFGIFILLNGKDSLTLNIAFVSLPIFSLIKGSMDRCSSLFTDIASLKVSIDKITDFLLSDETNPDDITHEKITDVAIKVSNVSLSWNDNSSRVLKNISFEVKKWKLIAIIGPVACGKSSLLSMLLGGMKKSNHGSINVDGTISYVPQISWILSKSIRKNILFGSKYDQNQYKTIIDKCCLTTDLEIMPKGDSTIIGEKGINLSGGQKQRISIARCAYANAEIYMLDDPLSSVDAHVGKRIFDNVIGPNGILKEKVSINSDPN